MSDTKNEHVNSRRSMRCGFHCFGRNVGFYAERGSPFHFVPRIKFGSKDGFGFGLCWFWFGLAFYIIKDKYFNYVENLNSQIREFISMTYVACGGNLPKCPGDDVKITQQELDYLRMCLKYMILDLEASRRERAHLLRLLHSDD